MTYHYETELMFSITDGEQHVLPITIEYSVHRGCRETRDYPGEPDTVEIDKIIIDDSTTPQWVYDLADKSKYIIGLLEDHARECREC